MIALCPGIVRIPELLTSSDHFKVLAPPNTELLPTTWSGRGNIATKTGKASDMDSTSTSALEEAGMTVEDFHYIAQQLCCGWVFLWGVLWLGRPCLLPFFPPAKHTVLF